MSNNPSKGPPQYRIRSLRPGGADTVCHTAPVNARAEARRGAKFRLSRLVIHFATGSAAFLGWVIPYLKSPFSIIYAVMAILVVGGILNATLNQAGQYLHDGYRLYAAFVSLSNPVLSFWHYGLYCFVAPIMGATTACIAGLVLAYISIGVGVGVAIWYAGWGTSNFYQYTLPGIIAVIQCGLMIAVFKRAAHFIFSAVIWLYMIAVAAFWAFILLFTCATWLHWLVEWSVRPTR